MTRKRIPKAATPEPDVSTFEGLVAALKPLIKKMQVLEAQSVAMGGAPDRESLSCPKCHLREAVLYNGQLITTRGPVESTTDTGLRFDKLTDGRYLCPGCGAKVVEPEPPPLPPWFGDYMLGREHQRDPAPTRALPPRRGTPGWYRVIDDYGRRSVDQGFGLRYDAPERLRAGAIVHVGANGRLRRVTRARTRDLFTYRAVHVDVLHGHLLNVMLEVPPRLHTKKRLRLRGMTCPDPSTPKGREAVAFIRSLLLESTEIVVTTTPSGFDACYLADVFLTSSHYPTHEVFLNEALLVAGLATRLPGDAPADDRDWGI